MTELKTKFNAVAWRLKNIPQQAEVTHEITLMSIEARATQLIQ